MLFAGSQEAADAAASAGGRAQKKARGGARRCAGAGAGAGADGAMLLRLGRGLRGGRPAIRARHSSRRPPRAAAMPPAPAVQLDRASFQRTLSLAAVRLHKKDCQRFMKLLSGCGSRCHRSSWRSKEGCSLTVPFGARSFTFDRPKTRCIISDPSDAETRLLLLREDIALPGKPEHGMCTKKLIA